MAHYNVKPLHMVLKPSRQLFAALVLAGVSATLIVMSMPLVLWIKLIGCFVIVTGTAYFVARDALLVLPWSWQGIELNAKGELFFFTQDGAKRKARVEITSFVAAYMTLLNITLEASRWGRHAVILTDSADSEEFRKFRVWLRWGMPLELEQLVADDT